ncbi:MAG: ABC transporter permease, partial [Thermoanaerobaculia bacterium]
MSFLDLDHWTEIYAALAKNKVRTALTAFGVFWGIFMLMVLLGSGNGLENGVTSDFSGSAANAVYMWTQRTTKPYRGLPPGRRFDFDNGDVGAIRQQVPEVEVIAPMNQLRGFQGGNSVVRGLKSGGFQVMGVYPQVRRIDYIRIPEGRFVNQ